MNKPLKLSISLLSALILGVLFGVFGTNVYLSSKQAVSDQSGKTNQKQATISGVLTAGHFGGTEIGCSFSDAAPIGDRMKCNSGEVGLGLQTQERLLWLEGYECRARQFFVKDEQGQHVEYETFNCTNALEQGKTYTVTGILELREDVWRGGKQVDEWWMQVQDISP